MVIQPPPPVGSELQKTDLAVVQKAQKTRTDAQTKRAVADNALTIFDFTSDTLGPNFVKEKLVVATPFFDRVYRDQIEACKEVKEHFNRQRPFVLDPEIKPIIKQPANASYPSGHSTTGYVYATVLAMMLPEKAQAIFDRAAEYGNNRIIAGVHFPTDVEAGKMSAAVIVNALVQQPLFVRDFERAKKEVRKVLDLK
jgi:acid phosphatase (class A)